MNLLQTQFLAFALFPSNEVLAKEAMNLLELSCYRC